MAAGARVLVVVPEFRGPELTDAVLGDLFADPVGLDEARVVVVDNDGGYRTDDPRVEVHRPGRNLRWIGATNWALRTAAAEDVPLCVVLNSDVRLSPGFLTGLLAAFAEPDVAVAAACYDDFWLHQRARVVPPTAAQYVPRPVVRDVPFCDGTAIAFAVPMVTRVGLLDERAFPHHGYGSDIDLALRVREAGYRCVVTEAAYVAHLRRRTMVKVGQTSEANRAEILTGMDARWGDRWRALAGLGPGAFPPHNTGSGASWYLEPPDLARVAGA